MKFAFSRHIFHKISQYQNERTSVQWEQRWYMRTNGEIDELRAW